MTVTFTFEPVTPTNPTPGRIWMYLLVNKDGRCAAASRHTADVWFDVPWDFGQPTHFARMPADAFAKRRESEGPSAPVGFELAASVAA